MIPEASITILGVVDAKGPVEGIAAMNEYGEYFYDSFLENINKYQFNKILDVGNITVYFCVGAQKF